MDEPERESLVKRFNRMFALVIAVELLVGIVGVYFRLVQTAIVGFGMALYVLAGRWYFNWKIK